jgi:hypothetical protein
MFLLAGSGAAQAATSTGVVYVVHGILGSPADVLMDGRPVANSAAPKTIVGPLRLTAGNHIVTLKKADGTNLVSARFTVKAGSSSDVVAHLTADAAMTAVVTVFVNDLSSVAAGKTRLVVSHVAVAPPADIRVDGSALFRNVANGESLSLVVPAKSYSADIVPTATTSPVILSPVLLRLTPGTLTRVFAVGDSAASTTTAIVQVLKVEVAGSGRTPGVVHTGDGGQTADSLVSSGPGIGTIVAVGLGLLLAAGLGIRRVAVAHERTEGQMVGHRHAR